LPTKVTKEHEEKIFVILRVPSGQALGARPSWIFSSFVAGGYAHEQLLGIFKELEY